MPRKAPTVRISKRGRITLPSSVRKALDLRDGDELRVRIEAGTIVLEPLTAARAEAYDQARIREFERESTLTDDELAHAKAAWRIEP